MTPACSIVLPTFDRAGLLPDAVRSVLDQTIDDWELIVVDDGSRDGTEQAVAPYLDDSRVRFVRQDHAGRSAARNHGVSLARAELICFLDSDDRYVPTTLAAHLAVLGSAGETGMTIGGYESIDEAGATVGIRRPWKECDQPTKESWLFNCLAMPGSIMLRREWFERVGGFDPELDLAEDWDLFLRLAFAGCRGAWVHETVCRRRLHPGNSTNDVRMHQESSLRVLEKLFRATDMPPETAALESRARSWVYAAFARNAAAAGQDALVRESLRAAADLDAIPSWERRGLSFSPGGFPSLLELPVADVLARSGDGELREHDLPARLSERWGAERADVRRAVARVHMSRFFDALAQGERREAAAHLRAGLRHDRRWLANRAVIVFLLKRPLVR